MPFPLPLPQVLISFVTALFRLITQVQGRWRSEQETARVKGMGINATAEAVADRRVSERAGEGERLQQLPQRGDRLEQWPRD